MGTLLLSLFLEVATSAIYPISVPTSFYSEAKIYSHVVLWSQLRCHSQNLQKLIVNVFTNKKKSHRIKRYNCASGGKKKKKKALKLSI